MRKLLFIINPRSGKRNSGEIIESIKQGMPSSISYDIQLWNNLEEFKIVEERLLKENFTDAIAVGGDGSVNLTGRSILNRNLTLGIIPAGSGNGLARSLGISMNREEAIRQIIEGRTTFIDSGSVNGVPFFCTSGMGFDAHIGNLFANLPKRGLQAYIKIVIKEFFSYKPKSYKLLMNGERINEKAFLVTVANAGQYGNNFYIAPEAKLDDGKFHVVVVDSFTIFNCLGFLVKVLRRKAHKSSNVKTFTCSELVVQREQEDCVHFDGEPDLMGTELRYELKPKSLKVITGPGF